MEMMICYNSGERELEGWKTLFKKAEPGLKLLNTIRPPGSVMSVMEVVLEE